MHFKNVSFIIRSSNETKVLKDNMNQAIQDAIWLFGSQNRLAKAVGVSQTAVRKWREGSGMDVRHAQKIEELTGGKVTARQISDGIRR